MHEAVVGGAVVAVVVGEVSLPEPLELPAALCAYLLDDFFVRPRRRAGSFVSVRGRFFARRMLEVEPPKLFLPVVYHEAASNIPAATPVMVKNRSMEYISTLPRFSGAGTLPFEMMWRPALDGESSV